MTRAGRWQVKTQSVDSIATLMCSCDLATTNEALVE